VLIGIPMNIGGVHAGAPLIAIMRIDGAWLGSIEIAQQKVYTARAFDMTTKELANIDKSGHATYEIAVRVRSPVAIFPGGVTLKAGAYVVGSLGISGGEQDHAVAEGGYRGVCAGRRDVKTSPVVGFRYLEST
jgi:uncharacterized protein GlcG (DUF336 family)